MIDDIEKLYSEYLKTQDELNKRRVVEPKKELNIHDYNTALKYELRISESGIPTIVYKEYRGFKFVSLQDAYEHYRILGDECNDLESKIIAHELSLYLIKFDKEYLVNNAYVNQ